MALKREIEVIPFFKDIRVVTSKCKPLFVTAVLSMAEIIVKNKFPFSSLRMGIFPHDNHLTSAQRAELTCESHRMSIVQRWTIHYQCGNSWPSRRNKSSRTHLFL